MDNYYISAKSVVKDSVPVFADKKINWQAGNSLSLGAPDIRDWTPFGNITFTVTSEKKTGHMVQIRFVNPMRAVKTNMAPYFRVPFKIDFAGEKKFRFDLSKIGGNYSPTLNDICDIYLDCSGWELTPDPETKITISDIRLENSEYIIESPVPLDDPSVFDYVKDNWREFLVGRPEGYSKDNAEINGRIKTYSENCDRMWKTFRETCTGEKGSAWGIKVADYPDMTRAYGNAICGGEVQVNEIYGRIHQMTMGYATPGCAQYKNPELLEDIKKALEYGYTYYYGPNVWEKGTYGNWWNWDIGIPLTLTKTIMLLEKDIGPVLVKRYLSPFDYLVPLPRMTACNKLWVTICILASAFLQCDAKRILISESMIYDIFDYVNQGDGFYEDGSFVQHGAFAYTGGYGLSLLSTLTELMPVFRGSRFELREDCVNNQYRWIFENYKPVIYKGNFMASMRGREVDRRTSEGSAQRAAVSAMIKMTTYAPKDIKAKLESLIRHYMLSSGRTFVENLPMMLVEYAENLYKDDSVKPWDEDEYVKVFGNMDRVVRHGKDYGVCIAPNSTRMCKYESINNENMDGWYQSEGMTYIYTGDFDYDYEFFNYVNPYKIPGTTVSTRERTIENVGGFKGKFPFVGGVEAGGNGLAVFRMGYPENKFIKSDIEANKSYFLFDGEVVCVGSGIKDTFDKEVITVIESKNVRNGDKFSVNGKDIALTEKPEKFDAKYAVFTNMGGYVFLDNTEITCDLYKNTNTFLEMTVSHGIKPENGKYAYVLLPGADEKKTAAYANAPAVKILDVSENVHVVEKASSGVTGYAFYAAGSSNGVTVSEACCVMVTEKDGKKYISVSDPTHLLDSLTVTLDIAAKKLVSADEKVSVALDKDKVTLTLGITGNCGQTSGAVVE